MKMKRLAVIISILFTFYSGYSQNVMNKHFVISDTVTADTGYVVNISANYTWQILCLWSGNDGTAATLKIQQSIDGGTTWHDYAGLSATTITGATGSVAYEDWYLSGSKIRVLFTHETGKTCILNLWYNFKTK